jgi:hypothetical protein
MIWIQHVSARARRPFSGLAAWTAMILAIALLAISLPAATLAQPMDPYEYGDAPEGAVAYPALGVFGAFPTCFAPLASGYVRHGAVPLAWFGPGEDFELDGNGGICLHPPYEGDECWTPLDLDAGLMYATTYTIDINNQVVPCNALPVAHIGDSCDIVAWSSTIDIRLTNNSGQDAIVNVLIDWDRDGRWGGSIDCPGGAVAEEHVLVNWAVPAGFSGTLGGTGAPHIQVGPDRGHFWARFTISPAFDPVPLGWDGSGDFEWGETEDYLISVGANEIYGEMGDAPQGVVAYPVSGVMGNFPTCLYGPPGHVLHAGNTGAWFGAFVDMEGDGNSTLCNFSIYDNDECDSYNGDAGLMLADPLTIVPVLNIAPCTASHWQPLGTPCQLLAWGVDIDIWVVNNNALTRWVNVLMDWDNDGQWGSTVTCYNGDTGSEHVLWDLPVPGGYVGPLSALGPYGFEILRGAGYVWSRFTISDQPVGYHGWDGAGVFGDGETEDYLFYISPGPTDVPPFDEGDPGLRLQLESTFPNPFNPRTEIAFTLARNGLARVTVHDTQGRRVAVLHDGELTPGRHSVTWDGRNDEGRQLPSGLYVVRVEAGDQVHTAKVTLLK